LMKNSLRRNSTSKTLMKIAIYSPYLDTAGGGEKYILTVADILSHKEQVDVLLDSHLSSFGAEELKLKNERMHGLNLSNVRFILAPIGKKDNKIKKYTFLKKYDFLFYNSDGSIFLSGAKNSIIHFQMPFDDQGIKRLGGKVKLSSWKKAIYNSNFTKDYIEKFWPIPGEVIYPPVDVEKIKPLKKKEIILSVGRFVKATKVKKHEEMINAFKKVSAQLPGWSFHLAGSIGVEEESYLKNLERLAKGYSVYFHPNISLERLHTLYGEAAIYWHFMGLNETDPKRYEHFGISTVEAMAGGAVPVVINKGGQKEIVESDKNGFLWNNLEELERFSLEISNNPRLMQDLSEKAIQKSKLFSRAKFESSIKELIYD
jgi:glycosyltransferase involved in cell wall biosynthesis